MYREKKFKSKWQKEEVDLFIFLVFYLSKKTNLAPEHFVSFFFKAQLEFASI